MLRNYVFYYIFSLSVLLTARDNDQYCEISYRGHRFARRLSFLIPSQFSCPVSLDTVLRASEYAVSSGSELSCFIKM